jgi:hypothetical protein
MKFDTQTKKNILSSKVTKVEVTDRFQDGRRRHVGNSSACYKMGNYHRTLMKSGTQQRRPTLLCQYANAYEKSLGGIKSWALGGNWKIIFHF